MTPSWAPRWPCPTCGTGVLALDPRSVAVLESRRSRLDRSRDDWFEDYIDERFIAALHCKNQACREAVVVSGSTVHEQEEDEEGYTWNRYLRPHFFLPAPRLISVPDGSPAPLRADIDAAFSLYWSDPPSCANRLRSALEQLLTILKAKRFSKATGQRRRRWRLSLHQRITLFQSRDTELGTAMLAVKWLGNEGSHPGSLKRSDLLDAFELLEYLLEAVFVGSRKRIAQIAREVNRRKGPRSRP